MSPANVPRAVLVTRKTEYERLIERHATQAQAEFFLKTRGQDIRPVLDDHGRFESALNRVLQAIPVKWRRTRVERDELDRFIFEPEDLVLALGQDGLVANVAKYLEGQTVLGFNPNPERYDGVLVPHPPEASADLIRTVHVGRGTIQHRTMVEAELTDGQRLVALNEIFIGHRSHQSARYVIRCREERERQSSSGVVVSSGTGATGWALSISLQRTEPPRLPAPCDAELAFFVREAFPSVATSTGISGGILSLGEHLELVSEMHDGGVIFGDGIEDDRIEFFFGNVARIGRAEKTLNLLVA